MFDSRRHTGTGVSQVRIFHCFICVIRWLDLLKEIVWIETYMNKICILTGSVSYWSQIIKFLPVQVREICVDFKNPSSVGSNKFLSRYTLKLMLISIMVYHLWRSVIVCLIKPQTGKFVVRGGFLRRALFDRFHPRPRNLKQCYLCPRTQYRGPRGSRCLRGPRVPGRAGRDWEGLCAAGPCAIRI